MNGGISDNGKLLIPLYSILPFFKILSRNASGTVLLANPGQSAKFDLIK